MTQETSMTSLRSFHRFSIGKFECTILWDGFIDHLYEGFWPNADPIELQRLIAAHDLPEGRFPMDLNPALIDTGDLKILIDAGMGHNRPLFGDHMGRLGQSLANAGIKAEEIDIVLLTHLHPDHAFGLIDTKGAAAFPNAQLVAPRADWEEWTDEANLARMDFRKIWTEGTLEAVKPYLDRVKFIEPGDTPFPGITVISGAGHSMGQCAYIVESQAEKVMFTGDVAHHHVFDPHHPEWYFHNDYDSDAEMGAETKAKIFAMAADEDIRLHGYHFPFPGLGKMQRTSAGAFQFTSDN